MLLNGAAQQTGGTGAPAVGVPAVILAGADTAQARAGAAQAGAGAAQTQAGTLKCRGCRKALEAGH